MLKVEEVVVVVANTMCWSWAKMFFFEIIFYSSFLAPEVVKLMYRITVGVVWVGLVQPTHLNPLHWYTLWAAMVFWVVIIDNWYWFLYQWLVHCCCCNKPVVHFGF